MDIAIEDIVASTTIYVNPTPGARADVRVLEGYVAHSVHNHTTAAGRADAIIVEGLTVVGAGKCQCGCQDCRRGRGRWFRSW